jgi:hypothetical protein
MGVVQMPLLAGTSTESITLPSDTPRLGASFQSFVFPDIHLRGMQAPEDLRLGPVFASGLSLGLDTPGDRQFYQMELRGESPNHGFSRLFIRGMTLFETLDLPALNVMPDATGNTPQNNNPYENQRELRFHQRFISVGLESPVFAELTLPRQFEAGWTAAFTLAQAEFKGLAKTAEGPFADYPEVTPNQFANTFRQNQAQQQAQFFAGELGSYFRYYSLYPFVPFASIRALPGSLLDIDALVKGVEKTSPTTLVRTTPVTSETPSSTAAERERGYRSGFQLGALFGAGVELYLGSRGLVGLEYNYWSWNVQRSQDWTHLVILKAGFLF